MSYYDFGDILKSLRKRRKLSQSELGKQIGLSKAAISKYETGINYPDYGTFLLLAKFFGVTTDYLLGIESENKLDISGLTERQIDIIRRLVTEYADLNEKSQQ